MLLKCLYAHRNNVIVAAPGNSIKINEGHPYTYQRLKRSSVDTNTCHMAANVINNDTGKWYGYDLKSTVKYNFIIVLIY